jgi:hypothetical protein
MSVTRASSTLTFKTFNAPWAFSMAIIPLPVGSIECENLDFKSWLAQTPHEFGQVTRKKFLQ